MVYTFKDCQIDNFIIYEKAQIANSFIFKGLSVNVEELFSDLI